MLVFKVNLKHQLSTTLKLEFRSPQLTEVKVKKLSKVQWPFPRRASSQLEDQRRMILAPSRGPRCSRRAPAAWPSRWGHRGTNPRPGSLHLPRQLDLASRPPVGWPRCPRRTESWRSICGATASSTLPRHSYPGVWPTGPTGVSSMPSSKLCWPVLLSIIWWKVYQLWEV